MKKKILSILTAAAMLLTLLLPTTAHAEEAASIWETYTFEEFLALSEEEVCAISEEIADIYTSYKELASKEMANYDESKWSIPLFYMTVPYEYWNAIDEYYRTYGDLEGDIYFCSEFSIEFNRRDTCGRSRIKSTDEYIYYFYLDVYTWDFMNIISEEELTAKIAVWLEQNTDIIKLYLDYGCGTPAVLPEVNTGDINMDDKVGILDVIMLSKHVIGILSLNNDQKNAADLNNDSIIDSTDVTKLMCDIVGKKEVEISI